VPAPAFATNTLPVVVSNAIAAGPLPTGIVRVTVLVASLMTLIWSLAQAGQTPAQAC
jgi:uncharacterized protein YdgA (DUF945 family)